MGPLSSESKKLHTHIFPSGSVRVLLYFCGRQAWELHWPQNVCYTWFQRRTVHPCGTRGHVPTSQALDSSFFWPSPHWRFLLLFKNNFDFRIKREAEEARKRKKQKRMKKKKKKRKPYFLTYIRTCLKWILLCFNPPRYGPGLSSQYSDWMVCGSSLGVAEIFRNRPDWPWGSPSPLHNDYWISFRQENRPRGGVDHQPHPGLKLKKE